MLNKLLAKPLNKEEVDGLVEAKLRWILKNSQPDVVWLFGSAARGEMKDTSDLDFILVFADDERLKIGRRKLNQNRPPEDFWPHDLLYHTRSSWENSLALGGGAVWLASQEGKILWDSGKPRNEVSQK